MFDRFKLIKSPESVHHTHKTEVVEKRAPTDEAVRLLQEMEAAARQRIIATIPIKDTLIDAVVMCEDSHLGYVRHFAVLAKFNGKQRDIKFDLDLEDCIDEFKVARAVRNAIAEDLANMFTESVFKAMTDKYPSSVRKNKRTDKYEL